MFFTLDQLTKQLSIIFQERNNLEQRIQQLNDSTLRYKEERAEDKEDMKLKENEIRIIQKVTLNNKSFYGIIQVI